mmetsp:Transcript_104659/g.263520  ORF Transcript_104659/g.263520 Transcript_104659/m.263520 type:complete len:162 (-) Transcript_104659:13-498(-)
MGAQAAWDMALAHGSVLAALAPIAACCHWPEDAWNREDEIFPELARLPIRSYSCETDTRGYRERDFRWLAKRRGLSDIPLKKVVRLTVAEVGRSNMQAILSTWGPLAMLGLIRGDAEGHNCWDMVYRLESTFNLFAWMASSRNMHGRTLLGDQGDTGGSAR